MRMTNWLATLTVLAGAFCVAAAPAFARQDQSQQQTGDSVADAARKAREQQKTQPKPKKVFTDDDVRPATRADQPAQPASGQAQAPDQIQSGTGDQANTGGEKPQGAEGGKEDPATMWKHKFADQRAKIAAAEKELDVLQREEQKAEVQYYPDPQKALQEQYSRQEINDKLAKIDAKKEEIAKLKQQLDDMEDELRKSGGDPGWARE
jgi:chromosome segregation ATPase